MIDHAETIDAATLRARAAEHARDVDARTTWLRPSHLASRWGVAPSTVRDIPRDVLPYIEFGTGEKLRRRRYDPADVAAYEAAAKHERVA